MSLCREVQHVKCVCSKLGVCLSVLPFCYIHFSCLLVLSENSLKHLVCRILAFPDPTESMSSCKRRYEQVQPQLQRDIVEDYRRGVRGHGYFAIAQKHGLPVRTVQHVVARGLRGDGDPLPPQKLYRAQEAKAER